MSWVINHIAAFDMRYTLPPGAGSDAVHTNPEYSLAVTQLQTNVAVSGTGITLTLGEGNRLVCDAIELLAGRLAGREIEEMMADFGKLSNQLANDPAMRWLGPQASGRRANAFHFGSCCSITNACFDLTPEQLVDLLDLTYLEEVLSRQEAIDLLRAHLPSRPERQDILHRGYPGYDTLDGL
jgi:L-fuconate dehydratase